MKPLDRRSSRRAPLWHARRRYARVHFDVDWMIDSDAASAWGHGLDLSPRSARLPLDRDFGKCVVLNVALPGRARLFRARGHVASRRGGLVVRFDEVSEEDLRLLADCLIARGGLSSIPQLDQKFQRFTELPLRFWGTST